MYTLSIKYRPKYISFSGGGAKGQCYIPVVYALEKSGLIANILVYGGSSAGAITAAILATGTTARRFEQLSDFNLLELLDYSSINSRGIYDGDILLNKVKQILNKELGERCIEALVAISKAPGSEEEKNLLLKRLEEINPKYITFADFNFLNKILPNQVKQLVITGTNTDDRNLHYFSATTTPDMEVALAVRISASFPFVFKSVSHNNKNFADGGIINNLPTRALYEYAQEECSFLSFEKKKEKTLLFVLGQKEKKLIDSLKVTQETKPGSLCGNYRYSLSYNFFNSSFNLPSKIKTWCVGVNHDFHETILNDDLANNYMKQLVALDTYDINTLDFGKKLTRAQSKSIENKLLKQFSEDEHIYEFDDPIKFLLALEPEDITKTLIEELLDQSTMHKAQERMKKNLNKITGLKATEKNNARVVIHKIKAFNEQINTAEIHYFSDQKIINEVVDLSNKLKAYVKPLILLEEQKIMFGRLKIAIGEKSFLRFKNNILMLCNKDCYQKPEELEFTVWWKYSKALLFLNYFFSLISKENEKSIDLTHKEKIIDLLKQKKIVPFQSLLNIQLLTEQINVLYQTSELEHIINVLETVVVGYQTRNLVYNSQSDTVSTLMQEIQELEAQSHSEDCQLHYREGYSLLC